MREFDKKDVGEVKDSGVLREVSQRVSRGFFERIVKEGGVVICGYDQGLGERLIVCQSFQDVEELQKAYNRGGARSVVWYVSKDILFMTA